MTQIEAENLKKEFAEWIDENTSWCGNEDSIVVTADTVEMFFEAMIECESRDSDTWGSVPVTIFENTQRRKGEPRVSLVVADLGDQRLVFTI